MRENESKSLTVREGTVPAMSEPATGQYADMEQLDIQSMFDQLLKQANHAAHEAEAHLQVEEKSNSVAELQGFCAGIRNFKSAANKAGFIVPPALFDTANRMEPWVQQIDNSMAFNDFCKDRIQCTRYTFRFRFKPYRSL